MCLKNSPGQYQMKCVKNSMENMQTDVRDFRIKLEPSLYGMRS